MTPDDKKVETVSDECFSTFEVVEAEMQLLGGSTEYHYEFFPDGSSDCWPPDWTG